MPTYEYKCPNGHKFELVRPVKAYQRQEECPVCDGKVMAERFWSRAPMGYVQANYPAYKCPVTDKIIDGRAAHEENLKRTGCRILEPGEREESIRRRAAEDAALEASIEATAEQFVENLPSDKREQLGRELESGVDVTVQRL